MSDHHIERAFLPYFLNLVFVRHFQRKECVEECGLRGDVLGHIPDKDHEVRRVLRGEDVLLVDLEEREDDAEEGVEALHEEEVEDPQVAALGEHVYEQREQPLRQEHVEDDAAVLEVLGDPGEHLLCEGVEDGDLREDASHARRVEVAGEERLDGVGEGPEGLLLGHADEEVGDEEVHGLAVADGLVVLAVHYEDVPHLVLASLRLEELAPDGVADDVLLN